MKRKLLSICSLILLIAMMAVACSDGNNAVAEVTEPVEEETTSAKETTARETTTPYEPATIPKEDDGNLAKTETPAIIDIVNVSPDMVCVAGKCEMDAVIIVRGGKDDVMFNADKNYFMGTVELLKDSTVDLQVTAKAPGKAESEPVSVQAKYRSYARQIRTDAYEVVVGGDSQGHFVSSIPYYEGTNLLEEAQITSLASRIKTRVEWLDQNMNGAELIYVLIPTSMTLYPETVPSKYVKTTEPNRLDQYIKGLTDGGATVIDLRDVMVAHKTDDLKLFHKTDSHWTEYGAWIAYCELMNHIAKKWEAAKPRTFEE
ncbi:MAG: DHHW family protein, partial [Oscillospiraceae bacterium]|nr:DHHW family protein [Oscillospiraceae bacterium]